MAKTPEKTRPSRKVPPVERMPVVALVGRPNVGKSTLFNRLLGERRAIVEDTPGVTRDRNYAEAAIEDRRVLLIDTGGFDPEASDGIWSLMREQVELALNEADVILFLLDTQHGLVSSDSAIYRLLVERQANVLVVANKADNPKLEVEGTSEGYQLGVEEVIPIAAHTRRNLRKLRERIVQSLPEEGPRVLEEDTKRKSLLTDEEEALLHSADVQDPESYESIVDENKDIVDSTTELTDDEPIAVAVIGKPNAGKSTLVNHLLGQDRLMTSNVPGTTRDSIDSWILDKDRPYLFIDTAGVRKKSRISDRVERFSVIRALESVRRADVALLVVDGTQGVTDQDKKIAALVSQYGKGAVILVNKWDLVSKDSKTADQMAKEIRYQMPFFDWAPILFLSAKTGQRVARIYQMVEFVVTNHRRRIRTVALNRLLRRVLHRHQLPLRGTKRARIYFGAQIQTAPPTFLFFANEAKAIPESYQRYIIHQLREEFELEGTSIRLAFRERARSPSKHARKRKSRK